MAEDYEEVPEPLLAAVQRQEAQLFPPHIVKELEAQVDDLQFRKYMTSPSDHKQRPTLRSGPPGSQGLAGTSMHQRRGLALSRLLQDAYTGDIIRWEQGRYMYVALKVDGQWYTTATELNQHVHPIMSSLDLARHLTQVSARVEYADEWEALR